MSSVTVSLKPDVFEGFRFDFTKMLGEYFALSHRYPARPTPAVYFPANRYQSGCTFFTILFCLHDSNSATMGNMELPSRGDDVIKVPTTSYEFGANFFDPKVNTLSG
jgi:mitochondrial import receptor subunit TOM40